MNYQFEVLTVRDIDFKDQSGREVSGYQLWVIAPTTEKEWNGHEVSKLWIACDSTLESVVVQLKRGDQIKVSFNRRGKPETIELL